MLCHFGYSCSCFAVTLMLCFLIWVTLVLRLFFLLYLSLTVINQLNSWFNRLWSQLNHFSWMLVYILVYCTIAQHKHRVLHERDFYAQWQVTCTNWLWLSNTFLYSVLETWKSWMKDHKLMLVYMYNTAFSPLMAKTLIMQID